MTEDLARRCVGLPFWQDLPAAGIAVVCAALPRQAAPAPRALAPA